MRVDAKIVQARYYRKHMSHAEVLLWMGLKGHSRGLIFCRQHPVGPYIADFYCAKARLVIEVDGQIHERENHPERDAVRDRWFAEHGMETVRIPAVEIMADAHEVSDGIVQYVREKLKTKVPPPSRTSRDTSPATQGRMRAT